MRLLVLIVLLLTCPPALTGCVSALSTLSDEDSVPALAALKQKTAAHQNHTAMVSTTRGGGTEVRIAVHQINNPSSDRVLVMVHGVMAEHSAYRFMVGTLAEEASVWLVDMPGCGESEKPDPVRLENDGYSPRAIGDRVMEAVGTLLRERPGTPPKVGLVGHSLGGAAIMRALGEPELRARHAAVLALVDSSVLVSPLDIAMNRPDPLFREIATLSGFTVGAASRFGVLEDRIVAGIRESVGDPARALKEEARTRELYLTDPARRRALQGMLRQAVPWRDGFRPDWEQMEAVVATYANIDRPVLIVWGERDEVLPCAMGYKLAAQIPGAHLVCLPRIKHSPEIECPEELSRMILDFVETGRPPAAPGPAGRIGHERSH